MQPWQSEQTEGFVLGVTDWGWQGYKVMMSPPSEGVRSWFQESAFVFERNYKIEREQLGGVRNLGIKKEHFVYVVSCRLSLIRTFFLAGVR